MANTEVEDLSIVSNRLLQRFLPRGRHRSPMSKHARRKSGTESIGQATERQSTVRDVDSTMATTGVADADDSISETGKRLCPVCFEEKDAESFPRVRSCPHRTCRTCLKHYFTLEIVESRTKLTCPECSEAFHPSLVKEILENDALMEKYENFSLRRTLMTIPDTRWCPAPDCEYAVIASNCASCPKLTCQRPSCRKEFCYHCKQEWHPQQTCDDARRRRNGEKVDEKGGRRRGARKRSASSELPTMKACPRCQTKIMKANDGSCNHITCSMCNAEFCWLCLKEISDLHFLSPSGCTFWGRKPWSRKKKILWQLGFLVGAPVGIGLIAAITPPAMMIAVPIYYGRKVSKRPFRSKFTRRLATAGAVTLAAIASPVLAALTVGIGVPLLLIYVYGVIPFELCRNGGCTASVSATTDGIRLDFEDTGPSGPSASSIPVQVTVSGRRDSPRNSQVAARAAGEPSRVFVDVHPVESMQAPPEEDQDFGMELTDVDNA